MGLIIQVHSLSKNKAIRGRPITVPLWHHRINKGLTAMALHMIQDSVGNYHIKSATKLDILKLAGDILEQQLTKTDVFYSPDVCKDFFAARLSFHDSERFCVLYLDSRNQLIEYREEFYGTVDGAEVHPRIIVQNALKLNACAVIFAHNHPSGTNKPSDADIAITKCLKTTLALIDVRVLDHILIGTQVLSFAEKGLL